METLRQVVSAISIHALLAESDSTTIITICTASKFLSTLSLRRATIFWMIYQERQGISIHALLAESDINKRCKLDRHNRFLSTLSLRRATGKLNKLAGLELVFLSTLSLRRATAPSASREREPAYFYPRSPCGERLSMAALR